MNAPPIYLQDLALTISEEFDEETLFSSPLGPEAKPLVLNGVYRSYETIPHIIGATNCNLKLYFKDGQLQRVELFPGADSPPMPWHEATKEKLLEEKTACDAWLKKFIEELAHQPFDASRVVSELDERSWSACIIFTYKK